MGINEITTLSKNPHFFAFLLQNFLTGYNKPCDIKIFFLALPMLMFSESREKLSNANSRSTIESLFTSSQNLGERKISGKTRLSGYLNRYNALLDESKKSLIILSSKCKLAIKDKEIIILEPVDYKILEGKCREWSKAAYYLGLIFAKTDENHLFYFLGVERL